MDDAENCSFCEVPLAQEEILQPVAAGASALEESAEPEWRREVAQRLEQYRARRRKLHPDDSQSGLPFHQEISLEEEEVRQPSRSHPRPAQRQRPAERVEIRIQPEFDFSSAHDDRAHPQTALVPVATLAQRRTAGFLDAFFLGLTCAGFAGLFRSLGGDFTFGKTDAIVYIAVLYLFYAQYFSLFTTFAGATPGMQLRGLTIVRLDGGLPATQQLLWRSFGYLLSGATLLLGFAWALWDEDKFTWQDRMSQTYVTAATPLTNGDFFETHPGEPAFARK